MEKGFNRFNVFIYFISFGMYSFCFVFFCFSHTTTFSPFSFQQIWSFINLFYLKTVMIYRIQFNSIQNEDCEIQRLVQTLLRQISDTAYCLSFAYSLLFGSGLGLVVSVLGHWQPRRMATNERYICLVIPHYLRQNRSESALPKL